MKRFSNDKVFITSTTSEFFALAVTSLLNRQFGRGIRIYFHLSTKINRYYFQNLCQKILFFFTFDPQKFMLHFFMSALIYVQGNQ